MSETDFAFIRPLWLLGLIVPVIIYLKWGSIKAASNWEHYIAPDKLRHLIIATSRQSDLARILTTAGLAVAVIAMAGPSFSLTSTPLSQSRNAAIIIFDLSPSMLIDDVKPSRLLRARLKLIDLLRTRTEGETALIAYADDAYRVVPLTDDVKNVEALVSSLHPNIMPAPGSNIEAAMALAQELLTGAGLRQADIIVITDGITDAAMNELADSVSSNLRVSVIGVGTDAGAPVPGSDGSFLKDAGGNIILARLDRTPLRALANGFGGSYSDMTSDDSDIRLISDTTVREFDMQTEQTKTNFDTRSDAGFWLALLLVPLGLIAFRRNLFWAVLACVMTTTITPVDALAFGWDDLWLRRDQRAAQQLESGDAAGAAELFEDRRWQGVARYRDGAYTEAAKDFTQEKSASDFYNRANAQALAGDYENAIKNFNAAIKADPKHDNARHNLDVLQKMMQQQEQKQGQDGKTPPPPEDSKEKENDDKSKESQSGNSDEQGSEKQQSDSSDGGGENQESETETQSKSDGTDTEEAKSESEDEQTSKAAAKEEAERQQQMQQAETRTDPEQTPLSDKSEQWLRSVPNDPGGLLRRKFQYQARIKQRRGQADPGSEKETRY